MTAMMWAAWNNHHAVVQKLLDARADVNTKNNDGCSFPACRGVPALAACTPIASGPTPSAGTRRCTMPQCTATPTSPCRCSSAAPTRPSRMRAGALCRPHPRRRQHTNRPARFRKAPRELAEAFCKLAAYDAAVAEVRLPHRAVVAKVRPPHRARPPPACAPCVPARHHRVHHRYRRRIP
jgi:hypothetical protein